MEKIKRLDIDIIILMSLPFVLGALILFIPERLWEFAFMLVLAIAAYEIIIFNKRTIYGFSGLNYLTYPSVLLLAYTVLIAAPSIYFCSLKDHPAIYDYFYSVISFYLLFPLGMLLAEKFWKIDMYKLKSVRESDLQKSKLDTFISEALPIILIIGIAIFALYLIRVKTIPLIELISSPGAARKFALLREEAFKLLKISTAERYLILWQRAIIMPFGILASLHLFLTHRKRKYLVYFILFFGLGMVFNSLTLEKSPTAAIFLGIMAFFYLRKKSFNLKFVILSVVLVFVLPIAFIYFQYYLDHPDIVSYIITALSYRVLVVPTEVLYLHFELFPGHEGFLFGQSSQLFSWLHPEGGMNLPNRVAQYWFKNPGTSVYANAIFLSNFWADFGYIGIFLSIFLVGFIIHWFYHKVLVASRYRKNVILMVLSTITMPFFTIQFISANITTLFFSNGLLLLALFVVLVDRFMNKRLYFTGSK